MGHLYHGYVSHNQMVFPSDISQSPARTHPPWEHPRSFPEDRTLLCITVGEGNKKEHCSKKKMEQTQMYVCMHACMYVCTYVHTVFGGLGSDIYFSITKWQGNSQINLFKDSGRWSSPEYGWI